MSPSQVRYVRWVKRPLDVIAATLILVLVSPLIAVLGLLVTVFLGKPVFFSQERPGKDGLLFRLYKFRSMRTLTDSSDRPLPDAQRLTPFGSFLRRSSLDELPELINILRGDMSFVGPRPLLVEYLPLYSPEQARRHEVRPGLTGWAQVNGRNAITWQQKFDFDVWYVQHMNFRLDCRILLASLWAVFRGTGVAADGQATTSPFTGNPPTPASD